MSMDRRTALARLLTITGTLAIGADAFLSGCSRATPARKRAFTPADIALMDEIGDTIVPATDTPGAKAVGIGAFMAAMAIDCYDDASFASLHDGLGTIDEACRREAGTSFMSATADQRTALLNRLDAEQRAKTRRRTDGEPPHYFRLMKELTLLGYFSSEIGCTRALRYVEAPGAYRGDVPYQKGDRAWFNPTRRV
jgi:glucoside 3-dehydrogenase (cytochrome c) hitch-hiker subunit